MAQRRIRLGRPSFASVPEQMEGARGRLDKLNMAQRETFEELDAVAAEAAKQYLFEEIQRLNQLVEELLNERS